MASQPEILSAGPAHLPVLAGLQSLAFADPARSGAPWTEQGIAGLLGMPGVLARLLCLDGEPLGMAMWRAAAGEAELLTIGVTPVARGRGHAGRLLADGLAVLAGWNVEDVFLEVAVTNSAAIALYASYGFKRVGSRRNYYSHAGQSIDADVMALNLVQWMDHAEKADA